VVSNQGSCHKSETMKRCPTLSAFRVRWKLSIYLSPRPGFPINHSQPIRAATSTDHGPRTTTGTSGFIHSPGTILIPNGLSPRPSFPIILAAHQSRHLHGSRITDHGPRTTTGKSDFIHSPGTILLLNGLSPRLSKPHNTRGSSKPPPSRDTSHETRITTGKSGFIHSPGTILIPNGLSPRPNFPINHSRPIRAAAFTDHGPRTTNHESRQAQMTPYIALTESKKLFPSPSFFLCPFFI